ncbi:hypothetical protein EC9_03800 [Rosistilla ulvae]|uniref:Uncharacterized protein n=2 Tax=Rosistilla ulvae TaxID=1930277 RepID=A0A517LUC1_9BACT|nr:hypothetical protein EC9_03800 [Rosistilla ulvae]
MISTELSPMQRLFLWSLAVSPGGGLYLKEAKVKPTPAGNRKLLEKQGLTRESGRPTYVELTDEGWLWVQEHLNEPIDTRSPRIKDVFAGLTQLLASYFASQDQTLSIGQMIHQAQDYQRRVAEETAEIVRQASAAEPSLQDPSGLPEAIQQACLLLTDGQFKQRVRLAELRPLLDSYARNDVDDALLAMQRRGELSMMRLENPLEIGTADRDAALTTISGQETHILYLQGASPCQPQLQ